MAFRSLRARLLIVQSALIVGLTVVTLAFVSVRADRAVRERLTTDLARSRDTIKAAETEHYDRLEMVAQAVASFPQLKAVFATVDTATIRDNLQQFRQRRGRDYLLLALDGNGKVLARSDTTTTFDIVDVESAWVGPAMTARHVMGELSIEGQIHLGALVAAEADGTVYGFVLAAMAVDDAMARSLRGVSDREVAILSADGVAGSTWAAERLPWRSAAGVASLGDGSVPRDVDVDGERFQAVLVPPRQGSAIRIASLQSIDRALAPYRTIQLGLLVLGVAAAGAGIAGSALLARSLTAPIDRLVEATRQVAEGSLDVPLSVAREDEIGHLARSFQHMTEGLRERAAMQKFVSQSTVDMIHRRQPAHRQQGERRRVTLLFSDIRGFTAFAETRSPEEAVRVLNRYLHLQADMVVQFRGDVDKFIGDAVFAHFAGTDMALDAIRCALEIQRAVDGASRLDPELPKLAVGIGIATGDVIIGSIGSDDRLDYTAIGPAVNLSARLCASADAQEILLSEETFTMVRDLVAADPMEPMAVKGFSAPVQSYRMTIRQSPESAEAARG